MKAPPPQSQSHSAQLIGGTPDNAQILNGGARGLHVPKANSSNSSGLHLPSSGTGYNQYSSPVLVQQQNQQPQQQQQQSNGKTLQMNMQAEPFFLKQHFKDQLAYLERDSNEGANICNVWVYNFEHELAKISDLLKKYTYVAMDTEFPGFLESEFDNGPEDQRQYIAIKNSVDKLKIIQLGITLSDEHGNLPKPVSTWQFNFDWDIETERKAEVSINKLKECGLDFNNFKHHGISPLYFAEKVMASGLVLNDRLTWICFHGNQDFGFLLKLMMNENLPSTRQNFEKFLSHYIPNVLDIKSFMHQFNLYGGLEKIAKQLHIVRMGSQHQAGSDSLVTLQVLFRLFSNFQTEADRKHYLEVFDQYNQDVYGFSNDQAFPTTQWTEAPPMPIGQLNRTMQGVTYGQGASDMHSGSHVGGHTGVHHVSYATNGQHPMGGMDNQLDQYGDFHDEEPQMDGRGMMGPFRPNQLNQFGPGRMQPPFDFMSQQQLQSLPGYHQPQGPPHSYMDHGGNQMHGSPGQDQQHNPFGGIMPPVHLQQLLMAANQNNLQLQQDGYDRRQGMNTQAWQPPNQMPMHGQDGNNFYSPVFFQQN